MSEKKKPQEEAPETENTEVTAEKAEETEAAPAKKGKEKEKKDSKTEELKKLTEDLASEKDKHLRTLAEYDNFRRRSAKERESIYADVRADTLSKLLPVYDNLERAIATPTTDEAYKKGVEMTMSQLLDIFSQLGVTEIPAKAGDKFDPEVHNAVMHVDDEKLGENVIAEAFQTGFKLGDKVIRHSMVKVAN